MKRWLIALAVMASGAGVAGSAHAQQKPEDVIKYRKAVMTVQSWNMRPMALMVKGQQPFDAALFAWYAGVIQSTSFMLPDAFLAGSDKGDTKARPEIWSDAGKFKATMDRFNADTLKLVAASKAGTLDAVRGPFGEVAKNCGGCHKQFRMK
ncbi:MAG TPA: cytochrome c [Burkholderiales bacterium]|nr:cytochrome c [Burkholderiales bacterium]